MNFTIDDLIHDDAIRRAVEAEDKLRDAEERLRVLGVQLQLLKERPASAPVPVPSVVVAVDDPPIVHSPTTVPVHKLRVVEHEWSERCRRLQAKLDAAELELNAAREAASRRDRDAQIVALDTDVLRQQVVELTAEKRALVQRNEALQRSVDDLKTALVHLSEQVESLSVQTLK
jgi:FtsZ-binding cell division protein ZapB